MARIYRVILSGESKPVAGIVGSSDTSARSWAQGRYGASAEVERVSCKLALSAGLVCEVLVTKRVTVNGTRPCKMDVIV